MVTVTTYQPTITYAMSNANWIRLITLSILWGSSFFLIEVILSETNPYFLVWGRVASAMVMAALWLWYRGIRLPTSLPFWLMIVVIAFFNNTIPFTLIAWGQEEISSGLAAILNSSTPLWGVLIAAVFLRQRIVWNKIVGTIVGIIGVTLMISFSANSNISVGSPISHQAAILAASLSYAIAATLIGRLQQDSISVLIFAILLMATVQQTLLVSAQAAWPVSMLSNHVIVALIALGVFSTAIAYILFFTIIRSAGAANATLVTVLVPVTALILSRVFLAEPIGLAQYASMTVILLGLLLVDGRIVARSAK